MPKKNYWKIDDIYKMNAEYNIVYGERSNGKSYAVKHHCAERAKDDNHKFIYLRRRDLESKTESVLNYFKDLDVKKVYGKQAKEISIRSGRIYVVYDIVNTSRTEKQLIGYIASLAGYSHMAGENFNDVENIIFEEFISREAYLPDEPNKLIDFVSTVARDRNIKVWLLGNTITRFCPYFNEWGLKGVLKQPENTIDLYNINTQRTDFDGEPIIVHIAVERTPNVGSESKMYFGQRAKMITGGEWQTDEKPHLERRLETYIKLYECVVQHSNFMFLCRFLYDDISQGAFWYVERKTSEIKPNTRVVSDVFNISPYHTVGFKALSTDENYLFKEFFNGKVVYSDNLTGTEFEQAIKLLR